MWIKHAHFIPYLPKIVSFLQVLFQGVSPSRLFKRRMPMPPQPGFGTQPKSRAVRVTVVGHASARWRSARNQQEADRFNLALSNQRANSVRAFVDNILRTQIPGVDIQPGTSLAPGEHPSGVQVGWYGVGSKQPLAPFPKPPGENNPLNRSVVVTLELITTTYGHMDVDLTPLHVSTYTRFWDVKVMDLRGGAVGGAAYKCKLAIRNPISDKVATYAGYLFGGGVGASISKSDPKQGIGDEVTIEANQDMGFDEFNGQMIRIEKASASLGVSGTVSYLTFVSLGPGASLRPFQTSLSLTLKPKIEAFVISGTVTMQGPNPGDWLEVDRTDSIPVATDKTEQDGVVLVYPTGKSNINDLTTHDRKRLKDFVEHWASRY
jgi:hypothetical protein